MVLDPETGYPADTIDAADNIFNDLVYRVVGYGITSKITEGRPYNGLLLFGLETQLPLSAENPQRIKKIP